MRLATHLPSAANAMPFRTRSRSTPAPCCRTPFLVHFGKKKGPFLSSHHHMHHGNRTHDHVPSRHSVPTMHNGRGVPHFGSVKKEMADNLPRKTRYISSCFCSRFFTFYSQTRHFSTKPFSRVQLIPQPNPRHTTKVTNSDWAKSGAK
jgi:hypothetical protein